MFPDISPITQGKREELTVVKKKRERERLRSEIQNVSASVSLVCQKAQFTQRENQHLWGCGGNTRVAVKSI